MTLEHYKIDENTGMPKYQQLVDSIISAIRKDNFKKGDKISSINEVCKKFKLSRDTVLMAYNKLKTMGIIESVPGKGYYISSVSINFTHKIFVLFDELNAFKENLYNSFIEGLKGNADVDLYFHNFNPKLFKNLINSNKGIYTSYVIMPANLKGTASVIDKLEDSKVFILDQINDVLAERYPAVYQDFTADMYNALLSGRDLLEKYNKLILVFPGGKEPIGQKNGFVKYCESEGVNFEIISTLEKREIQKGEVYIMPSDNDLVTLIKTCKVETLEIGSDVGIISYNDTPLKEVVCDGVTTISTDFGRMGKSIAEMVLNNERGLKANPSRLIRRSSL